MFHYITFIDRLLVDILRKTLGIFSTLKEYLKHMNVNTAFIEPNRTFLIVCFHNLFYIMSMLFAFYLFYRDKSSLMFDWRSGKCWMANYFYS